MAMFSDFSLKALIAQWNEQVLGPNPFVHVSNTNQEISLKFNPDVLKSSPSTQLQMLGDLSKDGSAQVNVMGGTIVYTVDQKKQYHGFYQLEVLTISSKTKASDESLICKFGHD